ncbi:MAG TPA: cupin domain-containing protein [Roseomonas sp.]|nr:cupin domain-containing protein [Roseomonas sp.]
MRYALLAAGVVIIAAATAPADAHGPAQGTAQGGTTLEETITPLFSRDLPNALGKALLAVEVQFPPGAASPPHTHPASAFVYAYVLSGEIISAVGDEQARAYRTGESWHEAPGAHHRVTRNASMTEPARLLAIFVVDPGEPQLVFPDPK